LEKRVQATTDLEGERRFNRVKVKTHQKEGKRGRSP